jgi:putative transposase
VAPDCAQQRGAGATSELEPDPSPLWRALDEAINQRDGKQRLQALVDELEKAGYTAAAKCLADDLDALVVHLRCPARQRRRWRSTNLLEGSLGDVKRRAKVIGRFPGETSCLTLVWAVLDLYTDDAHVSCAKPLGAR